MSHSAHSALTHVPFLHAPRGRKCSPGAGYVAWRGSALRQGEGDRSVSGSSVGSLTASSRPSLPTLTGALRTSSPPSTFPYSSAPTTFHLHNELPIRGPRYASGPSTFFRLPHIPFDPRGQHGMCDISEDDTSMIGIVGVPYDGGATNRSPINLALYCKVRLHRSGARHGPRGVRDASSDHIRVSCNSSPHSEESMIQLPKAVNQSTKVSPFELERVQLSAHLHQRKIRSNS